MAVSRQETFTARVAAKDNPRPATGVVQPLPPFRAKVVLGVTGIAGHSTRIGAAHDLVETGFVVAAIANAGGWKSLMMSNYYTRELRAKQSAMAQLIRRRQRDE